MFTVKKTTIILLIIYFMLLHLLACSISTEQKGPNNTPEQKSEDETFWNASIEHYRDLIKPGVTFSEICAIFGVENDSWCDDWRDSSTLIYPAHFIMGDNNETIVDVCVYYVGIDSREEYYNINKVLQEKYPIKEDYISAKRDQLIPYIESVTIMNNGDNTILFDIIK